MEILKYFNLKIKRQRQIIVWLSGLYGLLLGIISMFLIELRLGIESWFQLLVILISVAIFVIVCNSVVTRLLFIKRDELEIGSKFWLSALTVFFVLIASAVTLAKLI